MKKVTLIDAIAHELRDPQFKAEFEKQLLINQIATMLVKLRKRAKLTQKQLAERAGTSQPVIARMESGSDSRVPSLQLLAHIADAADAKLSLRLEQR